MPRGVCYATHVPGKRTSGHAALVFVTARESQDACRMPKRLRHLRLLPGRHCCVMAALPHADVCSAARAPSQLDSTVADSASSSPILSCTGATKRANRAARAQNLTTQCSDCLLRPDGGAPHARRPCLAPPLPDTMTMPCARTLFSGSTRAAATAAQRCALPPWAPSSSARRSSIPPPSRASSRFNSRPSRSASAASCASSTPSRAWRRVA